MVKRILKTVVIIIFLLFIKTEVQSQSSKVKNSESSIKVTILGASILSGYGLDNSQKPVELFRQIALKNKFILNIDNVSFPGAHSGDGIEQLRSSKFQEPDIIIIGLGLSDIVYNYSFDEIKSNLNSLINYIKANYKNSYIILLQGMFFQHSIMPNLEEVGSKRDKDYRNIFTKVSKHTQIKLFRPLYDNIYGQKKYFQLDKLHPNFNGSKIIANDLWKQFKPILLSFAN
jgi:lysophospholipase L1-like esterase